MAETNSPETPAAEPTQAPAASTQEAPSPPDFGEQISSLSEKVDGIAQAITPPETGGDESLYDQFAQYGQEDPNQYEDPSQYEQQVDPAQFPQQGQEPDPVETYIRERVAEAQRPYLDAQREAHAQMGLERLEQQHPGLKDPAMVDAVAERLMPLAQRYGAEVLTDPGMVEQAYLAARAAQVADSEDASEQEVNGQQVAPLETQAGASGSEGDLTYEDQVRQGLLSTISQGDAFT